MSPPAHTVNTVYPSGGLPFVVLVPVGNSTRTEERPCQQSAGPLSCPMLYDRETGALLAAFHPATKNFPDKESCPMH